MAFQLIYTSIRSGLIAGRSGFCTAARHREIKESLVGRLEDFASAYDRGVLGREGDLPILYSYRIINIRGSQYHVLMRLGDAGNDYSGRTNHLAHFLVIEPSELTGLSITPAEAILALQMKGFWKDRYEGAAAYLGDDEVISLSDLSSTVSLPAAAWADWSGAPGNAAHLFDSDDPQKSGFPTQGDSEAASAQLLRLFAEGALLKNPERSDSSKLWSVPFTTLLQSNTDRRTFLWAGVPAGGSFAENEEAAGRRLFPEGQVVSPPGGDLAAIAAGQEISPVSTTVRLAETVTSLPESTGVAPTPPIDSSETAGPLTPPPPALDSIQVHPASGETLPIPLHTQNGERRKEGSNSLKTILVSAAIVGTLVIIGLMVNHFATKERRNLEAEIQKLMDQGKWSEVDKRLRVPSGEERALIEKSSNLTEWKVLAHAIDRLIEIEESPHNFETAVPGKSNPGDAIDTVIQSVPESQRTEGFDSYSEAARTAGEEWEASKKSRQDQTDAIWTQFKAIATYDSGSATVGPDDSITVKDLEALEESVMLLYGGNDEINTNFKAELKVIREALPYLNKLSEYSQPYKTEEAMRGAEETIKSTALVLVGLIDKSSGDAQSAIKFLYQSYEALKPSLKIPEPLVEDPEAESEMEVSGETEAPDPAPTWPKYLIPIEKGKILDLTNIDEMGAGLPKKITLVQPGSETSPITLTPTGADFYIGDEVILKKSEKGLEIAEGGVSRVRNRTLLRMGAVGAEASPVFEVVVIGAEILPEDQRSLEALPISDCITRGEEGGYQIGEFARQQLERLDVGDLDGQWRLSLILGEREWAVESAAPDMVIDPETEVKEALRGLRTVQLAQAENQKVRDTFGNSFFRLGEILFPEFFKESKSITNLVVTADFKIQQGDKNSNPPNILLPIRNINEYTERSDYGDFVEYINGYLFERLDALADESVKYRAVAGKIEKATNPSSDSSVAQIIEKWVELANESENISENESWSKPPRTPGRSKTGQSAEEKLKAYSADLYFSAFFRGWEEVFLDEVKVKHLQAFLEDPSVRSNTSGDPAQKISEGEALLTQLESIDILDQLQVSFFFVWEKESTMASPDKIQKSFLVLRSEPDDKN